MKLIYFLAKPSWGLNCKMLLDFYLILVLNAQYVNTATRGATCKLNTLAECCVWAAGRSWRAAKHLEVI